MCSGRHPAHGLADTVFLPVLTDREGTPGAGEAAAIWRSPFPCQAARVFAACGLKATSVRFRAFSFFLMLRRMDLHRALAQVQLIGGG